MRSKQTIFLGEILLSVLGVEETSSWHLWCLAMSPWLRGTWDSQHLLPWVALSRTGWKRESGAWLRRREGPAAFTLCRSRSPHRRGRPKVAGRFQLVPALLHVCPFCPHLALKTGAAWHHPPPCRFRASLPAQLPSTPTSGSPRPEPGSPPVSPCARASGGPVLTLPWPSTSSPAGDHSGPAITPLVPDLQRGSASWSKLEWDGLLQGDWMAGRKPPPQHTW